MSFTRTYWSQGACNCHIRRGTWERLDCPVHGGVASGPRWITAPYKAIATSCSGRHCDHTPECYGVTLTGWFG